MLTLFNGLILRSYWHEYALIYGHVHFKGSAKQSYKDLTVNTGGGTICPTIIIIKSAKDSSSCKLHSYSINQLVPELFLVQMSPYYYQRYGAIFIAIPLQYIALMTWQYQMVSYCISPTRNYGLSNCINVVVKQYRGLFLTDY